MEALTSSRARWSGSRCRSSSGAVDLASQVLGQVSCGRLGRFAVRLELGNAVVMDLGGVGRGTGRHDHLARVGGPRRLCRFPSDFLSVASRTLDG